MKRWWWMLFLAMWVSSAGAQGLRVDDFAYGVTIDVPVGAAVAALSLPERVYANTVRRDLGDLRVFNAAGEPVPHMIRFAQTQSVEAPWQALAFFPIPATAQPETGGYRIRVRTGPDGAVVSVDPGTADDASRPARAFLVDLSPLRRPLAQLRLTWQAGAANLMATLAVDTSDNLVDWVTVQARAAISDIRYGGHHLVSDTIALTRPLKRYLRVRQLNTGPAVPLIRIDGRIRQEGRSPVRAYLWVDGTRVGDEPGVFEYRLSGVFPVDRINLVFDQANSMAEATVESRPDPKTQWVRRFSGLFYRMDTDQGRFTSAPQNLPLTMDRHWRLTVNASDSTIGNAVPQLEIGYRPHDLFFIARGRGPFTLAYGSAAVAPLKANVAALFDGISRQHDQGIERWVMPGKKQIVLGGPQRLLAQPKPLPTRRIVLWSVLVGGVLVVAGMAWRLARRMIHTG